MKARATRAVTITTVPTNIRKTPAFPNDPNAFPVTRSIVRYASGGGTIALVGDPFATGYLLFGANPVDSETIAINGVTFTFKTAASAVTEIQIGSSKEITAQNMVTTLRQSVNASITVARYEVGPAPGNSNRVNITSTTPGTGGNSYTLANSSGTVAVTRSAATLTGGPAYADGLPVAADTNFTDDSQAVARYAVTSAGSISLLVTDFDA